MCRLHDSICTQLSCDVTHAIHLCDMTESYVWHDLFICVTWLIHTCDITQLCVWHDVFHTYSDMGWLQLVGSIKLYVSFAKEPYKRDAMLQKRPIILSILLTVANDMAHSYVWHHLFIRVTWLIHTCDMTLMTYSINLRKMIHLYEWHDFIIRVTWLLYTSDMTHSYVWHDSYKNIRATLMYTHDSTYSRLHKQEITRERERRMNESCHTHGWVVSHIRVMFKIYRDEDMGWLLSGSIES